MDMIDFFFKNEKVGGKQPGLVTAAFVGSLESFYEKYLLLSIMPPYSF
jgi:hypothetical protein